MVDPADTLATPYSDAACGGISRPWSCELLAGKTTPKLGTWLGPPIFLGQCTERLELAEPSQWGSAGAGWVRASAAIEPARWRVIPAGPHIGRLGLLKQAPRGHLQLLPSRDTDVAGSIHVCGLTRTADSYYSACSGVSVSTTTYRFQPSSTARRLCKGLNVKLRAIWGGRRPAARALEILLCCCEQHYNPKIASTPAAVRATLTGYKGD